MMTTKEFQRKIEEKLNTVKAAEDTMTKEYQRYMDWNNLGYRYIADRDKCKRNDSKCRNPKQAEADKAFATRDSAWILYKKYQGEVEREKNELKELQASRSKIVDADKYAMEELANQGTTHEAEAIKATAEGEVKIIESQAVANVTMRKGEASATNKKLLGFILMGAGVLVLIALGFILYKKIKNNKTTK